MTEALQIRWIGSRDEFEALKPEWDSLVALSAPTVFLTHSWLSNWLAVLGDGCVPRVLTARADGRLVGALPLAGWERRGVRRWEMMGCGTLTPNHLDIVADPGYRAAALTAFVQELAEARKSWDVLDLDKLPEDTGTADDLRQAFSACGFTATAEVSASCPYAELPDTYDAYLASLSHSARRHTRERNRCLARKHPGATFGIVGTEEELGRALDALFALHQQRWQERGYAGSFADPRVMDFHRASALDALREGYLRFYTITEDEHVAAALLCYRVDDMVQAYSCCFDPAYATYRPGMILGAYAIEQSIGESAKRYDFLEGTELYKTAWADQIRQNLRLRVFSGSLRSRLAKGEDDAHRAALALGRRVLSEDVRESLRKLASRSRVQRDSGEVETKDTGQ